MNGWIANVCSFIWVLGFVFSLAFMWAGIHYRKAKQKADSPFPEHAFKLQSLEDAYKFMFRSAILAVSSLLALWIAANSHRFP